MIRTKPWKATGILLILTSLFLWGLLMMPVSSTAQTLDTWTFNTLPLDGNISGPEGATIGWGYVITNKSPNYWLFVYDIHVSAGFDQTSSNQSLFDYPVLAPGASINVPYGTGGLFELTWDANAPDGFANTGQFLASAAWYNNDPFDPFNPGNLVSIADTISSDYSAIVVNAVPEPSHVTILVGSIVFGLLQVTRKKIRLYHCAAG